VAFFISPLIKSNFLFMKQPLLLLLFSGLFLFTACTKRLAVTQSVGAVAETTPVDTEGDAADDPCIFVHPTEPEKSVIIGTNKKSGLTVYDLSGQQLKHFEFGKVNNVDIRGNFPLNGEKAYILAGSNRTDNTVGLFRIDPDTRELSEVAARPLVSSVDEVYGCCMYQNTQGKTYVFVVGKDGVVEQWELMAAGEKVDGKVVRTFDAGGQCEGLVADDELGVLYVAEEDKGIYKYYADPGQGDERVIVDLYKKNPYLKKDLEGLTIYYGKLGKGYLIASSQGNNSYAIYDRQGNNSYIGSFLISDQAIDGTSDTDGIDVTSQNLGPAFPNGLFIAQDGTNNDGETLSLQNFKLVDWEDVKEGLGLEE
jgi:3-phytase